MKKNKTIILASGSKDRKEIFQKSGIPFIIIVSDYEEMMDNGLKSEELAVFLAKGKLKSVKNLIETNEDFREIRESDHILISADTIVDYNDKIIGKALNKGEAFNTLKLLSGKKHGLVTGVCIYDSESGELKELFDKTIVEFEELDDSEIMDYLNNCHEYEGRAGSYSLRERASFFIKSIEGSPSNVIGMPLNKIYKVLKKFNINLLGIKKE